MPWLVQPLQHHIYIIVVTTDRNTVYACFFPHLIQLHALARRPCVRKYVMIPGVPPYIIGPIMSRLVAAGVAIPNTVQKK